MVESPLLNVSESGPYLLVGNQITLTPIDGVRLVARNKTVYDRAKRMGFTDVTLFDHSYHDVSILTLNDMDAYHGDGELLIKKLRNMCCNIRLHVTQGIKEQIMRMLAASDISCGCNIIFKVTQ